MDKPKVKAIASHIYKRGDGQAGTPWQYTVGYDVELALMEGFFNSAVGNFLVGDTIRVVQTKGTGDDARVVQYIDLMVVGRKLSPPNVEIAPLTPPMRFEIPVEEGEEPPAPEPEIYVPESCEVKWAGPAVRWRVIGTSGEVYAAVADKDQAHSIARGDLPLPRKAA